MTEAVQESAEFIRGRAAANGLWGKERADELRQKIHAAKGRTFIVVHDTMVRRNKPEFASRIDAALVRGIDSHWPVIFFEEDDTSGRRSTTKLRQHLKDIVPAHNPYIIETEWSDPTPMDKPPFSGAFKERWDMIRNILIYLGAKQIRVGGMYLSIKSAGISLSDPRESSGCVNGTWKELSKSRAFKVLPALSDGNVSGAPTTAREANEQLVAFLKLDAEKPKSKSNPMLHADDNRDDDRSLHRSL